MMENKTKITIAIIILWVISIFISFIVGFYTLLWYEEYDRKQGLMSLLGGEENYQQLSTIKHEFIKVYTLRDGQEITLSGDDFTTIIEP